jgi:hypothetical protein
MPTQAQVLATASNIINAAQRVFTETDRVLQKQQLVTGLIRTYRPTDLENGVPLPDERALVQVNVEDSLQEVRKALTVMFDAAATREWGNLKAKADIVVGELVLLRDVPAMYLVFLDKKLQDLHTFLARLPVLDPAEEWHLSDNTGIYQTEPYQNPRMAKVPTPIVKYHATKEHPAQVELGFDDKVVGTFTSIKSSGAIQAQRRAQLVERVRELMVAVKYARERANFTDVDEKSDADVVLEYVFR